MLDVLSLISLCLFLAPYLLAQLLWVSVGRVKSSSGAFKNLVIEKAIVVPYLGHILGEARSAGFPNLTDASDLITGRNAQDLDFHIKFVSETSHSFIGVRYDRGEQVTSTTNHTTLFCDESTCSSGQRKGAPAFQTAVA